MRKQELATELVKMAKELTAAPDLSGLEFSLDDVVEAQDKAEKAIKKDLGNICQVSIDDDGYLYIRIEGMNVLKALRKSFHGIESNKRITDLTFEKEL